MSSQLIGELNNELACRPLKTVFWRKQWSSRLVGRCFRFFKCCCRPTCCCVFFPRHRLLHYLPQQLMTNKVQIKCAGTGINWLEELKVAEHSFSARSCWCNLARAQGFQKTNMPSTERSFYLLKTRTICVIFLYNCMQCIEGFSILLQRYVIKGNDAKNSAIFSFCLLPKEPLPENPVKCKRMRSCSKNWDRLL